jgi:hypothetical protein
VFNPAFIAASGLVSPSDRAQPQQIKPMLTDDWDGLERPGAHHRLPGRSGEGHSFDADPQRSPCECCNAVLSGG